MFCSEMRVDGKRKRIWPEDARGKCRSFVYYAMIGCTNVPWLKKFYRNRYIFDSEEQGMKYKTDLQQLQYSFMKVDRKYQEAAGRHAFAHTDNETDMKFEEDWMEWAALVEDFF